MMKSPKRELVRAGCVEDVEESVRMEEVIPTVVDRIGTDKGLISLQYYKFDNN